ncbi:MAG: ATP-binding protein [Gemmatimonas sp.]
MSSSTVSADILFAGPGEMRALCRAHDWASTPLGPVESWSIALRTTVKTMLSSRHAMFLFWGPQHIQLFNDGYRASFGPGDRHHTALGARGDEFWSDIWDTIGPQIHQVLAGGDATWFEDQPLPLFRNGRVEGVNWTYSYSAAYGDDGNVEGVLVVCQETTAQVQLRRQLEFERGRLSYVFQQAPSFVVVLRGKSYEVEFVNESYKSLIGPRALARDGNLVGLPIFDLLPEAKEQGFQQLLDHVMETGEPYFGRETPIYLARTPGEPPELRYLDFMYFPLVEVDGTKSGVIAHGVDITPQVRARQDVEQLLLSSEAQRTQADAARAEADMANKAKGDFLAMLSHELRTPLAAISGYADLLSMGIKGSLNESQQGYLDRIQHSQRHLLGLIDGLLIYSQADAGKTQYHPELIPLSGLLASCETITAPQAAARNLAFEWESCDVALTVFADPEKTQQILINLISNAIKFTQPGGRISIACTGDSDVVRIAVRDTGMGIAAEDLARVFEPFVQLSTRGQGKKDGTGLGLAISQTFARGMGGDLTVESEVGTGSTFTLTLPASGTS